MSYINRAIEPLLIKKYQSYKSVAVTGARQVGKTRMTKELFPGVKSRSEFITMYQRICYRFIAKQYIFEIIIKFK